jgi:hypothetical protein
MVPTATGLGYCQIMRPLGVTHHCQDLLEDAGPLIEISHLNYLEADWILGGCTVSPCPFRSEVKHSPVTPLPQVTLAIFA